MATNDTSHIRNFSIVAHIDHGNRPSRTASSSSPTRWRSATWRRSCSTRWTSSASAASRSSCRLCASIIKRGRKEYVLNLIDTPGHGRLSYEVSRSLAACEGALLVVDAGQGIEAQTLANVYLALEHDLEIIPVINKIDLPSAQPDVVKDEIEEVIGWMRPTRSSARRRPAKGSRRSSKPLSSAFQRRKETPKHRCRR